MGIFSRISKVRNLSYCYDAINSILRAALWGNGEPLGINRTVGQIYALLMLSQAPLNADYIAQVVGDFPQQCQRRPKRTTKLAPGEIAAPTG